MEKEQTTKDTFTLRIPEQKNKSIKELAEKIGISQNSLILLFIEIGLDTFGKFTPYQEEFHHFLSQIQK